MRAMILADDPSMKDLLSLIVSRRGHQILTAAVPAGTSAGCDILVCDSEELLNTTPEELYCFLRQVTSTPENILFFAATELHILRGVRALGCTVLPKPFRLGAVFDWLDQREQTLVGSGLH